MTRNEQDLPLKGIRVLELAGLAPGPFLGLLLSTYGASVVRIDRPAPTSRPTADFLTTHKHGSLPLDLKSSSSSAILHSLLSNTDILIDPFRPDVLERLDLGASSLTSRYPNLIVVRLTGFCRDQNDKWRDRAGHDINYLAVSGVLSLLGGNPSVPPVPPANLLADFAGGGLMAFAGCLMALIRRSAMNKKGGLIVDSNMVDGAGFLATFARLSLKTSVWDGKRGTNLLDGGCPYYSCYECKDLGKYVAVGALEPQFFQQLLHGLDLDIKDVLPPGVTDRSDKTGWTFMKKTFESKIKEKTRDEWEKIFEGVDACVTPVKEMVELENEGYRNKMPVHVHDMLARDENGGGHPDDGIGWIEEGMSVGENAEQILGEWLGWEKEVDWREVNGTLVKVGKGSKESKL